MKQTLLLLFGTFTLGALLIIALNSAGYVIKVDIVAPEAGYTAIQREQLETLMRGVER
jgi:hypothetical protein